MLEHVYAGTERLKQELLKRRFALQKNTEAYVFGSADGRGVKDFKGLWRELFKARRTPGSRGCWPPQSDWTGVRSARRVKASASTKLSQDVGSINEPAGLHVTL
jgi:hypothetical protein